MSFDKGKDMDDLRKSIQSELESSRSQVKIKAEHTVAAGDTLSALALKYYGSAVKDKWMKIYEANKAVIGDNPNVIKPGQVLKIPEL